MADTYTAGHITDSTKIINTQIQQKTSTSMIAIHPETSSSMVVNEASDAISGETITKVLQNALPLKAGNNINITQDSTGVTVAFTGSLAPNVSVKAKANSPITVSEKTTATSAEYTVGVKAASTSQSGVVQLSNAIDSTSEDTAATSSAVRQVASRTEVLAQNIIDLTNNKQNKFNDGSATVASVSDGIISITPTVAQNKGTISSGTGAALQTYTKDKINSLLTGNVKYLGLGTAVDHTTGKITGFSIPNSLGDWGRVGGSTGFNIPSSINATGSAEKAHVGDILICTAINTSNPLYKWDVLHTEVDTNTWRPIIADNKTLGNSSTSFKIITEGSISQTFDIGTDVATLKLTGTDTNTQYELKQPDGHEDQIALHIKGEEKAQNTITINNVQSAAHAERLYKGITFTDASDGVSAPGIIFNGDTEVHVNYNTVGAAASSHTHGNITNAGALQTNDITVASGDKLVITDSSNSAKVARSSISFDGLTTTKALTPKGTWAYFAQYINSGVKADGTTQITSAALTNGMMTLGDSGVTAGVYSAVQVNSKGIVSAGAQLIKVYEPNDIIGAELATNGFALIKM